MIHLYALADRPVVGDVPPGVDGARVRDVPCGQLHAVVSEHPRPPAATAERALAHAEVVEAVCGRTAAVPVRYGSHHPDEATLRAVTAERGDELAAAVRRLGGRLEVVVRLAEEPRPAPPAAPARAGGVGTAGPGRRYLDQRLAESRAEHEAREVAEQRLRERTRALDARAVEVLERAGPVGPERCLLVAADEAAELVTMARQLLGGEHEGLVVGGPWPPYTFVGART